METQTVKRPALTGRSNLLFNIGEIFMVFLPPFLIIPATSSYAGGDPLKGMAIVGVSNITMLLMVWTGMKLRGENLSDFGLTFKSISLRGCMKAIGWSLLVAIIATGGFVLGGILMSGLNGVPESADLSIYNYMKDNIGMLMLSLGSVYIVSSFGEEVIYRAFLINRISQLSIGSKYSKVIAVVLSSAIFGLVHYQWGVMGMIQTAFMGLVLGICYVKLNKRLWILILAHAYMDTFLLVQMYLASN